MSSAAVSPRATADQDSVRWSDVSPWVASASAVARPVLNWYVKYRRLLWLGDAVGVGVAVAVTFSLRYALGQPVTGARFLTYGWLAPLIAVAWVLVLGAVDTRHREVIGTGLEEYRRVIKASLYFFGGLAILSYLLGWSLSRALFVTTLPLGVVLLILERWIARKLLHRLREHGRAYSKTLVIGSAAAVADTVNKLRRNVHVGYRPAAVCLTDRTERGAAPEVNLPSFDFDADGAKIERAGFKAVIVTEGPGRQRVRQLAWRLENRPIELMFVPRLTDVAGPRMKIREAQELSLMHVDLPRFSGAKLMLKRAFDIVVSGFALLLLSPVFLVVAILIKLDDRGPVFFRQERVGRFGEPFTIHKFRTMCVDAEAKIDALIQANGGAALLFKLEDDPRITRIGRILRKYSIDELPQFWTVLRGGMSVVGPRPQVEREVAEYSDVHHRRLLIKPGITGLWQVNGRSELSMEESIRLDLRYVENWSLIGDVTIVLKTVGVVTRSAGAF